MLEVLLGIIILPATIIWVWNSVLVRMNTYVWDAYRYTGIIGTPVHELSHAAACLLFGMKVLKVALYAPSAITGTLGYVKFSYRPSSITHAIGRVIQGIAPLITSSILLWWVLGLGSKMPEPGSVHMHTWVAMSGLATIQELSGLFLSGFKGTALGLLVCVLALHLIPSKSDIQVSLGGLFFVIFLIACVLITLDFIQANAFSLGVDTIFGVDLYYYGGVTLDYLERLLWMGVVGVTATTVAALIASVMVIVLPAVLNYCVQFVRGARGEV